MGKPPEYEWYEFLPLVVAPAILVGVTVSVVLEWDTAKVGLSAAMALIVLAAFVESIRVSTGSRPSDRAGERLAEMRLVEMGLVFFIAIATVAGIALGWNVGQLALVSGVSLSVVAILVHGKRKSVDPLLDWIKYYDEQKWKKFFDEY